MAFKLDDRIRETTTAPGTGNFTTNGALQGAQTFASVLTSNGDTTWATLTNGTAWETNTITRVSATVYSRGTPFASSNAGALVNFSSGTIDVFCDLPGTKAKVLERLLWAAAAISPPTNDGTALGVSGTAFSDLFLAVGAVIDWGAGDVLATHSSNTLVFTGASSGYSFDALLNLSGAAAGQISFPATQNASAGANTLDDYEEGTFTPTVTFGGAAVGLTYSDQEGRYQKVGNRVSIQFYIHLNAKGSSTGNALISGLPFTSASSSLGNGFVPLCFSMNTAIGALLVNASATTISLYPANSLTSLTDTAFANGCGISGTFTYQASA